MEQSSNRSENNYIHSNPLEAGFVEREKDYLHSSPRDYAGTQGNNQNNKSVGQSFNLSKCTQHKAIEPQARRTCGSDLPTLKLERVCLPERGQRMKPHPLDERTQRFKNSRCQ